MIVQDTPRQHLASHSTASDNEGEGKILWMYTYDIQLKEKEYFGNVLQAASSDGHEKVVSMLLNKGAEVNAQGGHYNNVLETTSSKDREIVIEMLLNRENV